MSYSARVVLALLAVNLAAGAFTGSTLFFRLSYLFGGLLIFSYISSRLALYQVNLLRTPRALRSQVGQVFEEHYEVQNNSRLPRLWIEVHDEAKLPGSHGSHVITLIGGNESRTYLARTRLSERGVFPLGPTSLVSGDLFGLFPVRRSFPSQDAVLVYPNMVEVISFPNPPGLLPGGEALRRRTPQITSNAAGVREYEPGDPLNRIHWASTARRERMMVKEFELDPLADVWLFVDAAAAVQSSKPFARPEYDPRDFWRRRTKFQLPPMTIEYAVTAAASLARYYLQRGRAVGLAYADGALRILPSDRGGRQLGKILEALALLQPVGDLPLQGLIEAQARHLPRGSTAVIVTSSTSDDVYNTCDLLVRRGHRPLLVALDPTTFGGYRSPERLLGSLKAMNIPFVQLSEGDDLSAALSSGLSRPSRG
ncbi:MAG: DUF58 domain-containing protein [Chloroflexota bacterium]